MPGLPFQRVDDQLIVVAPKRQEVHLLSPTAARIWDLLEGGATVESLVDRLTGEYDVAPDQARRDVEAALAEMRAKGMIVTEG